MKHGAAAGVRPERPDWTIDQAWDRYTGDYRVSGVDKSGALTKLRPRAVAGSVLAEQGPEPSNVVQPAKWLSAVGPSSNPIAT